MPKKERQALMLWSVFGSIFLFLLLFLSLQLDLIPFQETNLQQVDYQVIQAESSVEVEKERGLAFSDIISERRPQEEATEAVSKFTTAENARSTRVQVSPHEDPTGTEKDRIYTAGEDKGERFKLPSHYSRRNLKWNRKQTRLRGLSSSSAPSDLHVVFDNHNTERQRQLMGVERRKRRKAMRNKMKKANPNLPIIAGGALTAGGALVAGGIVAGGIILAGQIMSTPVPTEMPNSTPPPTTPFPTPVPTPEILAPTPFPTPQPTTASPTPAPVLVADFIPGSTVDYGFFAGTVLREPTTEELNGLQVQKERFYTDVLMAAFPSSFSSYSITRLVSTFDAMDMLPVGITFDSRVEFTDETITLQQVVQAMSNISGEEYLRDYVWQSEPQGTSLFFDVQSFRLEI